MNKVDKDLLKNIGDNRYEEHGAFNIRKNGKILERKVDDNINIVSKEDCSGIDVFVKENVSLCILSIPVIITESGLKDTVYNDFHIGSNSNVVILAGCGIHNDEDLNSEHTGIHRFYLGKNCKVKYIEKHYCEGLGNKVINPTTEIYLEDGSRMDMETSQIKGVDYSLRTTKASLSDNSTLVISEKIMTNEYQKAITKFDILLNGNNSSSHVVSRSVASDNSSQEFISNVEGLNKCYAHIECDAIIKDKAHVKAVPMIDAKHVDANLIHEATIGKIAGEQLIKLMTLGLSEKEAEEEIIAGFLK